MMIVAGSEQPKGNIFIGLCPADIEELKKGLTKTKHGNPAYGFRELVVFFGESDQANIAMIEKAQGGRKLQWADDTTMGAG